MADIFLLNKSILRFRYLLRWMTICSCSYRKLQWRLNVKYLNVYDVCMLICFYEWSPCTDDTILSSYKKYSYKKVYRANAMYSIRQLVDFKVITTFLICLHVHEDILYECYGMAMASYTKVMVHFRDVSVHSRINKVPLIYKRYQNYQIIHMDL